MSAARSGTDLSVCCIPDVAPLIRATSCDSLKYHANIYLCSSAGGAAGGGSAGCSTSPCDASSFLPKRHDNWPRPSIITNIAGTKISDSTVENTRSPITASAIGKRNSPPGRTPARSASCRRHRDDGHTDAGDRTHHLTVTDRSINLAALQSSLERAAASAPVRIVAR
jgi:hypothetical protein